MGGSGGRGPESVDHLTDGTRLIRVDNGHRWLTKVTGGGCALGALMAAFAATTDDPLLDSLATLDPKALTEKVVLS